MKAILEFDLPDDQTEFDAARLGRTALSALWDIDQHCRGILKYGDASKETVEALAAIRRLIPEECLDV